MEHLESPSAAVPPPIAPVRGLQPLPLNRLAGIARSLAHAHHVWRPLVRYDPERRWFMRFWSRPDVEAWLLTWTREQAVELHDHGGSAGAVIVVEGELTELFSDAEAPAPLHRATWKTGSLHVFGPRRIHDLGNRHARPATSIHVYSRPLSTMSFYDHHAPGFLERVRVENVPPFDGGLLRLAEHG